MTRLGKSFCTLLLLTSPIFAQNAPIDLSQTSLSDLMDMQVTSVAKKAQRVSEAAAAVYVVTQEDIRRSGATSIADALRLVPGLDVAQMNGAEWAISARGFNGGFANKLLVLVDGRTVYTPFFSGVHWDTVDVVLEDIDRIEVIRGPGGAIWGANAVNGVINVITMSARETQGGLVTASAGNTQRVQSEVRYGGALGRSAYYRVFGKFTDNAPTAGADGFNNFDSLSQERVGFRIDGTAANNDVYRLQGEAYTGKAGEVLVSPINAPFRAERFGVGGGDLMGSWQHVFRDGSDATAQAYYDDYHRSQGLANITIQTIDLDLEYHRHLFSRHEVTFGGSARLVQPNLKYNPYLQWTKEHEAYTLGSLFAQDEITLKPDKLRVTLGTKYETTNYTTDNFQPSVRLLWTPTRRQSVWTAVSRAVRNPSYTDQGMDLLYGVGQGPFNLPVTVTLFGRPTLQPETVLAYEAGYRVQANKRLSVDLASFFNRYQHLFITQPLDPTLTLSGDSPGLVLPNQYTNFMHGTTKGLEASVKWKVRPTWELAGSVTLLQMELDPEIPMTIDILHLAAGDSPTHQFQLRSHLNLPRRLEFDTAAYWVSALPAQSVPAYTRVDARLGWFVSEQVSLSVNGQNLTSSTHPEFGIPEGLLLSTELRRNVYAKLTWRF